MLPHPPPHTPPPPSLSLYAAPRYDQASSAPSAEWISDVFESAMVVWMIAQPVLSAEAQHIITDAVKGSPAARNEDGTPRDVDGPVLHASYLSSPEYGIDIDIDIFYNGR